MKREDIKIGMKVKTPKTPNNYGNSAVVRLANKRGQKWCFVTGFTYEYDYTYEGNREYVIVNEDFVEGKGDYFIPEELEPYKEENMEENTLKDKLNKYRELIDETTKVLANIKQEASEIEDMLQDQELSTIKDKLTPVVMAMFELEPKARFAFIRKDGRIGFCTEYPVLTDGFYSSTTEISYRVGTSNNYLIIGCDVTAIPKNKYRKFFWSKV